MRPRPEIRQIPFTLFEMTNAFASCFNILGSFRIQITKATGAVDIDLTPLKRVQLKDQILDTFEGVRSK